MVPRGGSGQSEVLVVVRDLRRWVAPDLRLPLVHRFGGLSWPPAAGTAWGEGWSLLILFICVVDVVLDGALQPVSDGNRQWLIAVLA